MSLCLPEFLFFFGLHTCIPDTSNPVYLRGGEDIIHTFLLVKYFFIHTVYYMAKFSYVDIDSDLVHKWSVISVRPEWAAATQALACKAVSLLQ